MFDSLHCVWECPRYVAFMAARGFGVADILEVTARASSPRADDAHQDAPLDIGFRMCLATESVGICNLNAPVRACSRVRARFITWRRAATRALATRRRCRWTFSSQRTAPSPPPAHPTASRPKSAARTSPRPPRAERRQREPRQRLHQSIERTAFCAPCCGPRLLPPPRRAPAPTAPPPQRPRA